MSASKSLYTEPHSITCPVCRQRTNKPFGELAKNRYIIQYLDSLQRLGGPNTHSQTRPSHEAHDNYANTSTPSLSSAAMSTTTNFAHTSEYAPNSEWDINEYYQLIFIQIDEDNDGLIDVNELSQGLVRGALVSEYIAENKIKSVFRKYDRDADGKINFSEFFNMMSEVNERYAEFLLNDDRNHNSCNPDTPPPANTIFLQTNGLPQSHSSVIVNVDHSSQLDLR